MYKTICLIFAMYAEALPLINELMMEEDLSYAKGLPMRSWAGSYKSTRIIVVINGRDKNSQLDFIGTQSATLNAHLAIEHYQPDLLISAGTAGAFSEKGASIGEVYLSHPHVVFHDRRVDIPGWKEMGVGTFPVMDVRDLAKQLNLKTGVVTTGSSLDMTEKDEEMIRKYGGEIKEMEAAAVAWVASLHSIPFFCVKSITDLIDVEHSTEEQFQKNLYLAVQNLTKRVIDVLDLMK